MGNRRRFFYSPPPSGEPEIDNWAIQSLFWDKESKAWRFLVIAHQEQQTFQQVEAFEFIGT